MFGFIRRWSIRREAEVIGKALLRHNPDLARRLASIGNPAVTEVEFTDGELEGLEKLGIIRKTDKEER